MKDNGVLLIIDDVQSNIEILGSILKDKYQIKVALDGKRALELSLLKPIPDLILLDVEMPDMDGFEVLTQLKANPQTRHVPVIFVTGRDGTAQEEEGLLCGAVDYITKPVRPVIVKARIKTHLTIKYQRDELIHRATYDQLTNLSNRHHLTQVGMKIFSKAKRQQEDFCAVIVDIDHFKSINDNHGHLIGDKVLKSIADLLSQNKRVEDFIARYGGEEFIILFDNCNLENASFKADILRQRIQNQLPHDIQVTASFGVAQLSNKHTTFESLIKDADDALYRAKGSGRNRVEIHPTEP